jgi:hypothetical protein
MLGRNDATQGNPFTLNPLSPVGYPDGWCSGQISPSSAGPFY